MNERMQQRVNEWPAWGIFGAFHARPVVVALTKSCSSAAHAKAQLYKSRQGGEGERGGAATCWWYLLPCRGWCHKKRSQFSYSLNTNCTNESELPQFGGIQGAGCFFSSFSSCFSQEATAFFAQPCSLFRSLSQKQIRINFKTFSFHYPLASGVKFLSKQKFRSKQLLIVDIAEPGLPAHRHYV